MINLQLQRVIFKKINSFFEIKENVELQVQNTFSLNVNYTNDNSECYVTLKNDTNAPNNPDVFNINIEIIGIFKCENIVSLEDKKSAHVQIYNYLFPYAQSMVAELCVKAGLPPLMIEMAVLNPSEVNIDK